MWQHRSRSYLQAQYCRLLRVLRRGVCTNCLTTQHWFAGRLQRSDDAFSKSGGPSFNDTYGKCFAHTFNVKWHVPVKFKFIRLVNPWCKCRARVNAVGLYVCVCVSVCLYVYGYSGTIGNGTIISNSSSFRTLKGRVSPNNCVPEVWHENKGMKPIHAANNLYTKSEDYQPTDFSKTASFES